MKKIIIAICLITLFWSCNTHLPKKKTGFEVQVEVLNKVEVKGNNNKNDVFYSVCINLVNNSDSIFSYWTSTCGWQDNFTFNVDSTGIVYDRGCDSNYPILKSIGPRGKWPHYVTIHFNLNSVKEKEIKIGFILVKEKEVTVESEYYELLNDKMNTEKDIIWSEPFKILE